MLYLRQICVSFDMTNFYGIGLEHYWAEVLPEDPADSMRVVRASCNKGAPTPSGVVACLLWQNCRHIIDYSFNT